MVDLDAEQGRSDPARPNVFRLFIRQTKKINLAILEEFLRGTIPFREDAQEAFSEILVLICHIPCCETDRSVDFLDHLLRETPSKTFIPIKRSFFSEDNPKQDLGNGVFAYKGIYQAIRAVHVRIPLNPPLLSFVDIFHSQLSRDDWR